MEINIQKIRQTVDLNKFADTIWGSLIKNPVLEGTPANSPVTLKFLQLLSHLTNSNPSDFIESIETAMLQTDEEQAIRQRFRLLLLAHLSDEFNSFETDPSHLWPIEFCTPDSECFYVEIIDLEPTYKLQNDHPFGDLTEGMNAIEGRIREVWANSKGIKRKDDLKQYLCLDITRQGMSWIRPLETWQEFLRSSILFTQRPSFDGIILAFSSLDSNRISTVVRGFDEFDNRILTKVQYLLANDNY